jgi:hypothetical protein
MTEENVVQLPTLLERLASKLKTCLTQEAANRQEWIAIQEAKCATLVEIRGQFTANIEFGEWCEDNGFGKDVLNPETRAAAIAMGRHPKELRECLEATRRRSLDTIHRLEFDRFCNITKTTRREQNQTKKPDLPHNITEDQAEEIIHRHFERGETLLDITHDLISPDAKRQSLAVEKIVAIERGRRHGMSEQLDPPLDPADMRQNMRNRYEATLRKARKELREEITAEINGVYDVYVRRLNERHTWAERIIASHKGVISKEAYRKVKACLHPDHNSFKFAAEALQIFSELEPLLVKPDEPIPAGPPLPTTAAELMARRREFQKR